MTSLIFIIVFVLIFIFIFLVSLVLSLVRGVFSMFRRPKSASQENTVHKEDDAPQWETHTPSNGENGQKVLFGKDEGEYVDFEEIKD